MPIYSYRCSQCGHAKDVLQKMSDAQLTTCPACGQETFNKQITAAGFQLKGSGWYVTDFRNNANHNEGKSNSTSVGGEAAVSATSSTKEASTAPNSNSTTNTTTTNTTDSSKSKTPAV